MNFLNQTFKRRRVLKILGVSAVGAITGGALINSFKHKVHKVHWQGISLGSPAEITIYHHEKDKAESIIEKSVKRINYLENLFMILLSFFQDPLFFMLLIFIVFWLFIIRPKQKQAKKENEFRNELKKGDKVVTAGGIHGRIVGVQEKTVFLECDDIKKIKIEKSMIYRLSSKD